MAIAGLAALLLTLAFRNHRSADLVGRRVAGQIGWLFVYGLGAIAVLAVGSAFAWVVVTFRPS